MLKRAKVPDNDIQSLKHENNVYHCKPHFYFMTRIMKNVIFVYAKNTLKPQISFAATVQLIRFCDSRIPKLAKSEISRYSPVFNGPIWKSQ